MYRTTRANIASKDRFPVGPISAPSEGLIRLSAHPSDSSSDRVLAAFVAELFSILHPATLPMLEFMFEDVKQDAESDGELELKRLAEIGIAAAKMALQEQEAIET